MDEKSLKYTKSHEWIEPSGDRRKVGISDHAQEQLGDIVFVEFPAEGKVVAAGDEVCVIESCKATASVYAPVAGRVVAFNRELTTAPDTVNREPYGGGWLFELEVTGDDSGLLDQAAYAKTTEE